MKDGYIKVAAVTPQVTVADVKENTREILKVIREAAAQKAKIIVLPELCITGYTCGDLFSQDILLSQSAKALEEIAAYTTGKDGLFFVGLPYVVFNVAAATFTNPSLISTDLLSHYLLLFIISFSSSTVNL